MRVAAIVLGVLSMALAADASACLRKMPSKPKIARPTQVTSDQQIASAEKALGKGELGKAARLARAAMPRLHELAPIEGAELAFRAQRVAALAAIRAEGKIDLGGALSGHGEAGRLANLAWAQLVLDYQSAMRPDNVIVQVQLAEALAASAAQQDRALAMLRDLSDRDVMPTARGYAVLARLQADHGDTTARDAALGRCRELGGAATCRA